MISSSAGDDNGACLSSGEAHPGRNPADHELVTEPELGVELDEAFEQDRWRHATVFMRVRGD